MVIKAGVGLFPQSFRNYLKKSPALTSFYSHSLQKSGLFYGFPSKKKRMALYSQVVTRQEQICETVVGNNQIKVDVLIWGDGNKIRESLNSLNNQTSFINSIYCISESVTGSIYKNTVNVRSIAEIPSSGLPVLMINAGDQLHHKACANFSLYWETADIVYCDTDEIIKGVRQEPALLPDWNPDLQFSTAYISTGVVIGSNLLDRLKRTATGKFLRDIASIVAGVALFDHKVDVVHIPLSLCHAKTSKKRMSKCLENISSLLSTEDARVLRYPKQLVNCIQWPLPQQPLISLIIPTKNAKALVKDCIESILTKTTYNNYEIILVDNNSDEQASLDYFDELSQHPKITLLKYPQPFNYSAINNFAVKQCKGEVIGLVNNDIEVITPTWLDYMVGHVMREDIGCVGAKLLYSDGRVQHAGVVMGYGGGAGHAHKYFPRYHPGYLNRLIATNNFSAVTAACLLVKRTHYEAVNGLNEKDLTVAFNDVDFCLKVRELGVRNLYCAEAELYHHESVSRGLDVSKEKMARFNRELAYLKEQWGHIIEHDPAYNPNLTLRHENFAIKDEKERREEARKSAKA